MGDDYPEYFVTYNDAEIDELHARCSGSRPMPAGADDSLQALFICNDVARQAVFDATTACRAARQAYDSALKTLKGMPANETPRRRDATLKDAKEAQLTLEATLREVDLRSADWRYFDRVAKREGQLHASRMDNASRLKARAAAQEKTRAAAAFKKDHVVLDITGDSDDEDNRTQVPDSLESESEEQLVVRRYSAPSRIAVLRNNAIRTITLADNKAGHRPALPNTADAGEQERKAIKVAEARNRQEREEAERERRRERARQTAAYNAQDQVLKANKRVRRAGAAQPHYDAGEARTQQRRGNYDIYDQLLRFLRSTDPQSEGGRVREECGKWGGAPEKAVGKKRNAPEHAEGSAPCKMKKAKYGGEKMILD